MTAILSYAGLHRVSIMTAAHVLDPDGEVYDIKDVITAIDAKNRIPYTCAGDYWKQCEEAARKERGE